MDRRERDLRATRRACILAPAFATAAGWLAGLDEGRLVVLAVLAGAAACAVLEWVERQRL